MKKQRVTGRRQPFHPTSVHIGTRLRILRSTNGMSQEELAKLVGVSFQQIQKYERGANRLSADRLYDLACVFRVPVWSFFEGLPEPESGETAEGVALTKPIPLAVQRAFLHLARVRDERIINAIIGLIRAVTASDDTTSAK